jgi:multidrug transporter EmrE-like cation transporter
MLNARAVFALFVVLIVLPIVTVWVAYRVYKVESLKTREERFKDLKKFGLMAIFWLFMTSALVFALRAVLRVDLVSAGGLPGALLLAALSLLWFENSLRTKATVLISCLLLAVIVHAALNLIN